MPPVCFLILPALSYTCRVVWMRKYARPAMSSCWRGRKKPNFRRAASTKGRLSKTSRTSTWRYLLLFFLCGLAPWMFASEVGAFVAYAVCSSGQMRRGRTWTIWTSNKFDWNCQGTHITEKQRTPVFFAWRSRPRFCFLGVSYSKQPKDTELIVSCSFCILESRISP